MSKARLIIADDHVLILDALRNLLDTEFDVVAVVENGRALVDKAIELRPDVVLIDISMPVVNGVDAARMIRQAVPDAKLLFVSMHGDPVFVREAFRAGAAGYVLKRSAASELVIAIREVLKGNSYVTPLVTKGSADTAVVESGLTVRQREVLQLIADGCTAKEVASKLQISVKTAQFHKAAIATKLGIRTTAQLTRYALDNGLLSLHG